MTKILEINIINSLTANNLIACSNFLIFLEQQAIHKINTKVLEIPWNNYQAEISEQIINALINLKYTEGLHEVKLPKDGLKGIYFCMGDDGLSLDICGSLYFNETDWAANADFYPEISAEEIIEDIERKLILLNLDRPLVESIISCFMLFTISQSIARAENIEEMVNTGIAFGYSDGDELILGHFTNGLFTKDIKIIENGEYENP